jgi:hypothetical protein
MSSVKSVIAQAGTPRNKVKVGVNINWEKVCGCPAELIYSTDYYNVSGSPAAVARWQSSNLLHAGWSVGA